MKQVAPAVALLLVLVNGYAQQQKIRSVTFPEEVHFAAVDRPGDLYLVLKNGEIRKIDKDGALLGRRKFPSLPDLFDPRDGVLAFAYFRSSQILEYLAPDLSTSSSQMVPEQFAVRPWLVCPTKNEIWILDSADLQLKHTTGTLTAIDRELVWPEPSSASVSQLTYLREYQNFLFVLDRTRGVHVLNPLGKIIKTLGQPGMPHFHFLGEEFYYHTQRGLLLTDLYTAEERTLPLPYACDFALLTDERLFIVSGKKLEVFTFTP